MALVKVGYEVRFYLPFNPDELVRVTALGEIRYDARGSLTWAPRWRDHKHRVWYLPRLPESDWQLGDDFTYMEFTWDGQPAAMGSIVRTGHGTARQQSTE